MTSRLLVEVGCDLQQQMGRRPHAGQSGGDLVRVVEQCASGARQRRHRDLTYRSPNCGSNWQGSFNWRASASMARAQSMKFGYQGGYLMDNRMAFLQQ